MSSEFATFVTWMIGGAVFLLVVSVWLIGTIVMYMRQTSSEEKLSQRLVDPRTKGSTKPRILRLWHKGKLGTTTVPGGKSKKSIGNTLDSIRRGMKWKGSIFTFIIAVLGMAALGFVVTYTFTQNLVLSGAWFVALPIIVRMIAEKRLGKEEQLFERQLADGLGLAARSLRAGHPLLSAFQVIVEELDAPVKDTFAEIVQQQALGKSLEDAILTTAASTNSDDMKLFAASTVIQIRSGGNLADMMERVVAVIRDRIRLQRRVRVLTAQTQLSKRVLIVVPIGLFLFLVASKPEYVDPLFTTRPGHILLIMAFSFLVLGSWVMNKIATLRY